MANGYIVSASSVCIMRETHVDLLQAVLARPATFVVGWRHGEPVENAGFLRRVGAWHALLQPLAGKKFALYMDDSIEFAAALLGAWHAGKTIWLSADTLEAGTRSLALLVDGFLGHFPAAYLPLNPPDHAPDWAADRASALAADFPALVVTTSGTTGAAQSISKRLGQLLTEVRTLETLFGARLGDAEIVATVSHQHIYGLLFKVLWPLAAGRAIHALSQNFPEELAQLMAKRDCVLIASPAHLKRLPDHLEWAATKGRLRAVFSSGGPLSCEVAHATGKLLGEVPIEVYGSSETGGIAWRQRHAGSDESWQALPGVAWRIVQPDGLLEVCSPHLPDTNWLRLADRVEAQSDTRFLLNGRSDRIVKIEEKRISLDAIEALLLASELVAAVRILVCDEVTGQRQRLAAFVVTTALGGQLLAEHGKRALNQRLNDLLVGAVQPVALPRRWRYLDEMPTDRQGKVTRALLLALLDARPRMPEVQLIAQDALRVELCITVPPTLLYLDGHFPNAPILAGVVQVDWAIHFGRAHFALPPQFLSIHALKFQRVIFADTPVTLELSHDLQKGVLQFRYSSDAAVHSSGRIFFGAGDV